MPAADDAQDARARAGLARTNTCIIESRVDAIVDSSRRATFPAVFHLRQRIRPRRVACHLLGPKRNLLPQHHKFGASFCTARECDRIFHQKNSEE
jgi:hypothetical protein